MRRHSQLPRDADFGEQLQDKFAPTEHEKLRVLELAEHEAAGEIRTATGHGRLRESGNASWRSTRRRGRKRFWWMR